MTIVNFKFWGLGNDKNRWF